MDTLASLLVGAGGLMFSLLWLFALVTAIGLPIGAFVALRHLKSIRVSLEQIARVSERLDYVANADQVYTKTGPLSIR